MNESADFLTNRNAVHKSRYNDSTPNLEIFSPGRYIQRIPSADRPNPSKDPNKPNKDACLLADL
jgi:hypothetical protein